MAGRRATVPMATCYPTVGHLEVRRSMTVWRSTACCREVGLQLAACGSRPCHRAVRSLVAACWSMGGRCAVRPTMVCSTAGRREARLLPAACCSSGGPRWVRPTVACSKAGRLEVRLPLTVHPALAWPSAGRREAGQRVCPAKDETRLADRACHDRAERMRLCQTMHGPADSSF
jgi:hypothetical protein